MFNQEPYGAIESTTVGEIEECQCGTVEGCKYAVYVQYKKVDNCNLYPDVTQRFNDNLISDDNGILNAVECQKNCAENSKCQFFTYNEIYNNCRLFIAEPGNPKWDKSYMLSGPKMCLELDACKLYEG